MYWCVLATWEPKFKTEDGKDTKMKYFRYVPGVPDCETTQQRAIFSLENSEDELVFIPYFIHNS